VFKKKLGSIEKPLIWVINISAAFLSWKYWEGLGTEEGSWKNGVVTIVALIVLTLSSFWVYFRADKQVRDFLSGQQVGGMFTTATALANIKSNPVRLCLYSKSSIGKLEAAFQLAGVWTLAALAIALPGPSASTISGAGIRMIPFFALGAGAGIWLLIWILLLRTRKAAAKDWFSLSSNAPTANVPSGYVPGVVMCTSPTPLKSWGSKNYYVCNISAINGPNMPQKGAMRDKVTWRYMKLP
jgi:hypothetical protein